MKNRILYAVLLLAVTAFYGCEKLHDWNKPDETKIEYSSIYPLSGEWWVQYFDDDSLTNDVGGGFYPLYTYNTSADDGKKMWIWDMSTFWTYRVKCPVTMKSLSFKGDNLISTATYGTPVVLYDIWLNVSNGKVIENGTHSTSGVVTDSIYMELEFEDDPGSIYYVSGHRRTGFIEDEH